MAYQGGIVVEGGDGALSLPSKIPLQNSNQIARGRIRRFESDMPSQAVRLRRVNRVGAESPSGNRCAVGPAGREAAQSPAELATRGFPAHNSVGAAQASP